MAVASAKLSSGLRNCIRLSRHLADEIAVAGVRRDMEIALAVLGLDPRLNGDDLAVGCLSKGAGNSAALGQQLEILLSRMDQGAPAGLGLIDCLLGTDPDRVHRL